MSPVGVRPLGAVLLAIQLAACHGEPAAENAGGHDSGFVVIYSSLDEALMAPVYQAFRKESGIRVQQTTADNDRLLEMMKDKHRTPPADVFLAGSAVELSRAAEDNVFRPTFAEAVDVSVPRRLRDPDLLWFGLATRAIAIGLNSSVSKDDEPDNYEALADNRFQGRICLSSSSRPENVMLIAALIEQHGRREAELIVRRMMANLAMPVFDDVQSMVSAVQSGQCQAAILLLDTAISVETAAADARIRMVMADVAGAGTLIDVIGAGIARHAGNPTAAQEFLRWLAGERGQRILAAQIRAQAAIPSHSDLRRVPGVHADPDGPGVARLGALRQDAIDLAERAHYP